MIPATSLPADPPSVAAPEPVGRPRPSLPGTCRPGPDGTWWWDEAAATLHALPAAAVVPTDALLLAHCRAEDRDALARLLSGTADASAVRYVLHAADGTQRPVLAVAAPGTGTRPVVVLADLSAEIDTAAALRADVMLAEAVASRSRIDQAKGALMLAYGLDEEAAFAVLRWHSEHLNIKIRTAAERLCAVLPHPGDVDPRDRLDAVLAHGADLDSPAPGRARPGRGRPAVDRGLTVRRTPPGREVVVSVAGEVDASTVPGLMSGLHEALRAVRSTPDRPGVLVVDLSAVGRLGPLAGLHLGRLRRRCERAQVQLRLVAPAPGGRARSATAPDNDVSPDRPTREDAR